MKVHTARAQGCMTVVFLNVQSASVYTCGASGCPSGCPDIHTNPRLLTL